MLRVRKIIIIQLVFLCIVLLLSSCRREPEISLAEAEDSERTVTVENKDKEDTEKDTSDNQEHILSEQTSYIAVFVCGAVNASGVYELQADSRLHEAIAAAGGFSKEASQTYLNQAEVLSDGQKIYVPTEQEVNDGLVLEAGIENDSSASEGENQEKRKININTASTEELMTIPGIGEAKAASIIKYRETNGRFQAIEDIMNIQGIKEGVFSKIQDYITV